MKWFGSRQKNKKFNNRPCRFCGASNWTPIHKCPAIELHCNKCGKKGQCAKACRQKFNDKRTVKRQTEEKMNEPDESSNESDESIHHMKEIKEMEETNKHYTATVKTNGVREQFVIDTGSQITIMPVDKRIVKPTEYEK